jgi:hypothetical protein
VARVFISYRSVDLPLVERLAYELRQAGHQVWLDIWDIQLGDSLVERINEGLTGAAYVVACFSSAGAFAPWMGREWMSTLARQLQGHGVKLLPVLLAGGTPPPILADVRFADLARSWAAGVNELLRAIR